MDDERLTTAAGDPTDEIHQILGAGGLGDIAYQYGFQRYQPSVMYATIVVLIVLVQIVQTVGDICAKKLQRD